MKYQGWEPIQSSNVFFIVLRAEVQNLGTVGPQFDKGGCLPCSAFLEHTPEDRSSPMSSHGKRPQPVPYSPLGRSYSTHKSPGLI